MDKPTNLNDQDGDTYSYQLKPMSIDGDFDDWNEVDGADLAHSLEVKISQTCPKPLGRIFA